MHVGTHIDGALHATDGREGDMASYPLEFLVNKGVVVDISDKVEDWGIITPDMITSADVKVEQGDILILHTGYHRYYEGRPQQDLVRYFCMHPGGKMELVDWMLDMKINWWGIDCGSGDHPMNTTIRFMRRTSPSSFENHVGMSLRGVLPALQVQAQTVGPEGHQQYLPLP